MRVPRAGWVVPTWVACLPDFDVNSSIVREPRVIAVVAEPPEARPGASVRYEAVAVGPGGRDVGAPIAWTLCATPRPSSENGAVAPACLLDPAHPLEPQSHELSALLPLDACGRFGPDPPPGDARPRDPDGTGGFYQPLVLFARGERYVHLQRLICNPRSSPVDVARDFAARYVPNRNPPPPDLALQSNDGAALETGRVAAGRTIDLTLRLVAGSAEEYVWIDPGGAGVVRRSEALLVSWFSTDGEFELDRSFIAEGDPAVEVSNRWTAPQAADHASLWVVVRDDRGGTAFIERELTVSGAATPPRLGR